MRISIHALREESDQFDPALLVGNAISIHALREESDSVARASDFWNSLFLSTLSVRRATLGA